MWKDWFSIFHFGSQFFLSYNIEETTISTFIVKCLMKVILMENNFNGKWIVEK